LSSIALFFFSSARPPPCSTLFPYTTLFRSELHARRAGERLLHRIDRLPRRIDVERHGAFAFEHVLLRHIAQQRSDRDAVQRLLRSEEHTSELQSHLNLVCRLLLEKKK